jgi:acetate kinase
MTAELLAINCGSSTVKYARYTTDAATLLDRGTIEVHDDHGSAVRELLRRLPAPIAVSHRIVHGGAAYVAPVRIDDAVLRALGDVVPFAPLHLPAELAAIAAVREALGDDVVQVACFDTAFHRTMPTVARTVPLPAMPGVERYGFHGLSYEYLASVVPAELQRRAVFAHLGSGASLCAIRDGRSVDTTMGFSPAGGVVMATRTGDLDPGLVLYLLDHGYDRAALDRAINHDGGLRGISGVTGDMRTLLATRDRDARARLAVDVFCYAVTKAVGAFAAVLGGLDALVFTGGIGEHAAPVRDDVCASLRYLGAVDVRVVTTDEEKILARAVATLECHARSTASTRG